MNSLKSKTLVTLALFAFSASLSSAVVVESFEVTPLTDPTQTPANPPYIAISRASNAGVTDGTYSMRLDVTNGFSWLYLADPSKANSFYPAYGVWYNHRKVKMDLYVPAQPVGWNHNFYMAINNQGGWQQFNLLPTTPFLAAGQSTNETVTWDYGSIRDANSPGGFWLQLVFAPGVSANVNPGTVYVDKVRFVDAVNTVFTFPTNTSGGDLQGWTPQGWGTALAATYWDATDAKTNPATGSMYCFCDFGTATTNQTAVYQVWNVGIDTTEYAKLSFDVKVDASTSFLTTAGDYGFLQVVLRGSDIDWNPLGPFNIPASATNAFVHYELPLYQPLPTNMLGINLIFGGTNFQGAVNYYVDNLAFTVETNSPTLNIVKALPGLEISAAGNTTDQRQGIRTATGNYNWTTAAGAVTYAMTIDEGLSAQAAGMFAYIFLVGTTNSNPAAAGDYNESNGIFLEVRQQSNGLCSAGLLFKTNAPNSNGIRYTPSGVLATVSDVPMVGTWSVTLNQGNFSLSTPGGGSASGSLPAGVLSQFSTNVFPYFGLQANSAGNYGQYVDLSRVQITGMPTSLDQVFTGQSSLNTNVLVVRASNPAGVQMRPPNIVYRLSWPAPPSGVFALQSASVVTGPYSNPGLPAIVAGARNITFLPATSLPSTGAGYFRLQKQ